MKAILKSSDTFGKKIALLTAFFFLFQLIHFFLISPLIDLVFQISEGETRAVIKKCKELANTSNVDAGNLQTLMLDGALQLRAFISRNFLLAKYCSQVVYNFSGYFLFAFIFRRFAFGPSLKKQGDWSVKNATLVGLSPLVLFLCLPMIAQTVRLNDLMQIDKVFSYFDINVEQWSLANMIYGQSIFLPTDKYQILLGVIALAVIPAFGEELLFRGTLQRFLVEKFGNIHNAIFVTAFIFSSLHLDINGFFYRFFLGVLFGYVYVWSRSLWPSIVMHALNNMIVVINSYVLMKYKNNAVDVSTDTADLQSMILGTLIISGFGAGFLLYYYYQQYKLGEEKE